ncbi:MAG: hypothetical protein NTY05_04915 [Rhodocyclales bacterium]|nr:hypothetical protein [Rhodocyclales bacterium]
MPNISLNRRPASADFRSTVGPAQTKPNPTPYRYGEDRSDNKGGGFIVVNQIHGSLTMSAPPSIKVDWLGNAPNCDKAVDDGWAKDNFVKPTEQKTLAELTGLTVRLGK